MPAPLFETPGPSRVRRALQHAAAAYAWIVILASLAALGFVLLTRADAIHAGFSSIMGWSAPDGTRHAGWLLRYDGFEGYLLAAVLFGALLAAAVGSTLRTPAARQSSLLALLVWSAIWCAGAARQLLATGGIDSAAATGAAALGVACTYARARHRWVLPTDRRHTRRRDPLTA